MKKIINVDLKNNEDLYEKYNSNKVSRDLINYLIENTYSCSAKDKIMIVINNYINSKDCVTLIKNGFEDELLRYLKRYYYSNFSQIVYFILGIIILFIATYLGDTSVIHEILLISGWVLIWEMVEIELFADLDNRRRRRMLQKLKKAEFVVKAMDE